MAEQQRKLDEFDQQAALASAQAAQQLQDFAKSNSPGATGNPGPSLPVTKPLQFSVKAGEVKAGTKLTISCPTQNAVIYYSTAGWTPTTSSHRYSGPITLLATTQIAAIAVAPSMAMSPYASASYKVKGPPLTVFPLELGADGVLHAKTRLHLATASAVSSKNAKLGAKISIVLDQDVKVGDLVEIPKGTSVDATITAVTQSGLLSTPGMITFAVHSLAESGTTIALQGGERVDGTSHTRRNILLASTIVGAIPALAIHGNEAEIKPDMKFTVAVVTDTPLKPSVAAPMVKP